MRTNANCKTNQFKTRISFRRQIGAFKIRRSVAEENHVRAQHISCTQIQDIIKKKKNYIIATLFHIKCFIEHRVSRILSQQLTIRPQPSAQARRGEHVLRREAKIIFYSYAVDATFLASWRLERNNAWGPNDWATDRSLHGRWAVEWEGCDAGVPYLSSGEQGVCLCARAPGRKSTRGMLRGRVREKKGNKRDERERKREVQEQRAAKCSRRFVHICIPRTIVCVATCEIQALFPLPAVFSSFAAEIPFPFARHYVYARFALRWRSNTRNTRLVVRSRVKW